ncbi:hypothetical protein Corgl_0252 [Coriobacterium glomerans PW2]|uniref:Uncharacterized protein n=1 Tax=Coriobacterium glomerans (strain ATCC 49209 / DSM 20642 / JCM 10262 / PW2) TaxID=700015 RepID=F2N739_CORGP|nr:ABC transporter permease [Coriobacterium glomerans]AEB06378.1 hypothetical protein Corgl_0252 [Coriobacterium glomerans PW2]
MFDLLKADLYRMSRPTRLHGYLWKMLAISVVLTALSAGILLMMPSLMQSAHSAAGDASRVSLELKAYEQMAGAPSTMIGSALMSGSNNVGMLPLIACFGMIIPCLSDFNRGFAASVTTSRRGRLGYLAEKTVLAGIWSAIVFVFMAALVVCMVYVLGKPFRTAEPIGELAAWAGCCWLCLWALTAISLALAFITRNAPVTYLGAILIMMGVVPNLVELGAQFIGAAGALAPVADGLHEMMNWFPSHCAAILRGGVSALSRPAAGTMASFPGGFAGQAAIAGITWVALAGGCTLAWARRQRI